MVTVVDIEGAAAGLLRPARSNWTCTAAVTVVTEELGLLASRLDIVNRAVDPVVRSRSDSPRNLEENRMFGKDRKHLGERKLSR